MATETKLRQLAQGGCPVYYFYSSERYLVRQAVARAAKLLAEGEDEETTVLDGAAPEIEQLIMAAGTISFFGTRRVVLLPEVDPAAYSDKDLDELCATLAKMPDPAAIPIRPEEKIAELQQRKAALVRELLGDGGTARALTREDLAYLLAPVEAD